MTIARFINNVNSIILNPLIGLIFALSVAYFFWGVVKFLSLPAGDKGRDEAKSSIIWSIVGMVVIFSVFGLIRFVLDTFGITPDPNSLPYLG